MDLHKNKPSDCNVRNKLKNLILYFSCTCRRVTLIINSSFVSKQYGVRSRHTTSHAIINLFHEALAKLDNRL